MKTQTENAIKRSNEWHRPYYVNFKQVEEIKIYFNNEILFISSCGWLEHERQDVIEICRISEVLNRRKVKLDGKHFIVKEKSSKEYKRGELVNVLYLHARCENQGEFLCFETDEEKNYRTRYKLFLSGIIKDGYLDENKQLQYKEKVIPTINLLSLYRIEKKPLGEKLDEIYQDFRKFGFENFSTYTIKEMLKHYELTKKAV